ncbi:hypothetical protein [Streptomyces sp. bgisy091]|uniref:hypothetical protein n=1 Tax=Streptomyces sp. bgisy091 TaxID=3413778 RepID=UPI003D74DFB9
MADFELPESIAALNDDELTELLDGATAEFNSKSTKSVVTPKDIEQLRALAKGVEEIRTEQAARVEAAAEIDALAAQVRGNTDEDTAVEPTGEETAAAETAPAAEPAEPAQEPEQQATASAMVATRPALNLSGIRRRQRRAPEPGPREQPGKLPAASSG